MLWQETESVFAKMATSGMLILRNAVMLAGMMLVTTAVIMAAIAISMPSATEDASANIHIWAMNAVVSL